MQAVCLSQNRSATILFPLLHELPYLSLSILPLGLSSPSFSFNPCLSSAPTQPPPPHACTHTDTQTFSPASAYTSILDSRPLRFPLFSRLALTVKAHISSSVFPRVWDILQSLELINGKVAARNELWEKDNKMETHQCLPWPVMGANENTSCVLSHPGAAQTPPALPGLQLLGFTCVPLSLQAFTF